MQLTAMKQKAKSQIKDRELSPDEEIGSFSLVGFGEPDNLGHGLEGALLDVPSYGPDEDNSPPGPEQPPTACGDATPRNPAA
jgi:hypothetical protein